MASTIKVLTMSFMTGGEEDGRQILPQRRRRRHQLRRQIMINHNGISKEDQYATTISEVHGHRYGHGHGQSIVDR